MTERFYWKVRLVSKGPWVPLMTWLGPPLVDGEELDRPPRWQCLLRNETTGRAILFGEPAPIDVDDTLPGAERAKSLSLRNLERIDQAEYLYLRDHHKWATENAPEHPHASPRKPVDRRGPGVW